MRAVVTSLLDLVGLLLVVVAVAVLVWPWTIPGAFAIAGAGLLGISWLIDRRQEAK